MQNFCSSLVEGFCKSCQFIYDEINTDENISFEAKEETFNDVQPMLEKLIIGHSDATG